jgi:hypothetical protein
MNISNLKDTVTTICAWITVVGGAILGAQVAGQTTLPVSITGILTAVVGVALAVTQFLTGKNPNGTTKSDSQVVQQNSAAKRTIDYKCSLGS